MYSDPSTLLAIIALGCCANAGSGAAIGILGSLLLGYTLSDAAAVTLIGAIAAAAVGLVHAFVAPRVPNLRNASFMPTTPHLKESCLALVYAPAWSAIAAGVASAALCASRTAGWWWAGSGLEGIGDVGLGRVLSASVAGTAAVCIYVTASFKILKRANVFLITNHVIDMLEWAEQMRHEENRESAVDAEKDPSLVAQDRDAPLSES